MQKVKINGKWDILLPESRLGKQDWDVWEAKRLASMYETTKPGDVVFYVGAETGDMPALLAMWGARLVLFEPNEKAWPTIKAIWRENNLPEPMHTYPGFASDKTTYKQLHDFWPLSTIGEIIPNHGFKELKDPGGIPEIKIDDVVEVAESSPDMISIDVEGSEGRVLRGAEQTLRKYHPRIYLSLHPEFIHEQYGEDGFNLRLWIRALGYEETLLDYEHEVHLRYD